MSRRDICSLHNFDYVRHHCTNFASPDNVRMVSVNMTDPLCVITPGRDRCLMARYDGIIVFCSLALHFSAQRASQLANTQYSGLTKSAG